MAPAAAGPLVVGVPTEVKSDERRVALTPDGVRKREYRGEAMLVQSGADLGSAIPDNAYVAACAGIVAAPHQLWARAGPVSQGTEPHTGVCPSLPERTATK